MYVKPSGRPAVCRYVEVDFLETKKLAPARFRPQTSRSRSAPHPHTPPHPHLSSGVGVPFTVWGAGAPLEGSRGVRWARPFTHRYSAQRQPSAWERHVRSKPLPRRGRKSKPLRPSPPRGPIFVFVHLRPLPQLPPMRLRGAQGAHAMDKPNFFACST